MDEITPYNLPPAEPPVINEQDIYNTIQNSLQVYRGRINVGAGDSSMHIEKTQGIWLGAEAFADAPFSVNMQGDLIANSVTVKNSNNTVDAQAGEALVANNAVCLIRDISQVAGDGQAVTWGHTAGVTQLAMKIKPVSTVTSSSIAIFLGKVGAPADNVTFEIQGDSSGSPDNTPITNGSSNTVAGGTLTTTFTLTTMTTSSAFTLTGGTTYWLVMKRSGAVDAANYYILCSSGAASGAYGNFTSKNYNGATWGAGNGIFYARFILASGSETYTAWKTDSDSFPLSSFYGFANATIAAGATGNIVIEGVLGNFSNLTQGKEYYLSGTAGSVSETQGSYGSIVGVAISTTQILIQNTPKVASGIDVFTMNTTVGDTRIYPVGFKPRIIYYEAGSGTASYGESKGIIRSASSYSCIYNNLGSGTANANTNNSSSLVAAIVDSAMTVTKQATVGEFNEMSFSIPWTAPVNASVQVRIQWHAIG